MKYLKDTTAAKATTRPLLLLKKNLRYRSVTPHIQQHRIKLRCTSLLFFWFGKEMPTLLRTMTWSRGNSRSLLYLGNRRNYKRQGKQWKGEENIRIPKQSQGQPHDDNLRRAGSLKVDPSTNIRPNSGRNQDEGSHKVIIISKDKTRLNVNRAKDANALII